MKYLTRACLFALLSVGIVGMPAVADVFDAPGNPRPIPDVGTSGATVSTIEIDDDRCVKDINVIVEMSHPFAGDLDLELTHVESGTTVHLIDSFGDSGDYDGEYVLDDEAGVAFALAPGTYDPFEPLDAFDVEPVGGAWDLTIIDNFGGDSGALYRFALDIELRHCGPAAIFSPSANKSVYTPSGLQHLKQANAYELDVDSGEITLVFDGLALGLQNLDCIHRQDDGLFVFSTSTNKTVATPAGFVNLNAGNAYRLEADGTITLVINAVLMGGVDACQFTPGIAPPP